MPPTENSTAKRRLGYQPALDGLRAVAVLLVFSVHAVSYPSGGFLGVDIFFVLSGFLITTILLEEWDQYGRISLSKFYLRRFLRLFPALVVLLLGYMLIAALTGGWDPTSVTSVVSSLFYVSNWLLAFDVPFHGHPLGHLWSLAVEEQFYLLWPALLLLLLARRPRNMVRWVAGAIAVVAAWRLLLSLTGASDVRLYFSFDTRFDELLVGCAGGILFVRHPDVLGRISATAYSIATYVAGGILLLGILFSPHAAPAYLMRGGYTLMAICALVLILSCVQKRPTWLASILALPPMVFVGKISYPLYLWHVVILFFFQDIHPLGSDALGKVVQIALTFGAAVASYYFVERPFLHMKDRFARRRVPTQRDDAPAYVSTG
jgi:peptidoglycan/LPS O-acetylase OafA/YrhL